MKIVFINGPKGVGKDTIGNLLAENFSGTTLKMARPIKEMLRVVFALNDDEYNYFVEGSGKDVACDRFFGYSPRSLMIDFSEQWAKRLFGQDVFGKLWLHNQSQIKPICFVTDTGFGAETHPITSHFGPQNCALIRLHRLGLGYQDDSRGYVELNGILACDISTDTTIKETFNNAIQFVHNFLSTTGAKG